MQHEDQPETDPNNETEPDNKTPDNETEPDRQPQGAPTGPDRYAFTPPEAPPHIEFKKVRRPATGDVVRSRRARRGGRRRLRLLLPALGLVVALLIGVGVVGVQGYRAAGHLRTAAGLFAQLQQQIKRADVTAAQGTLTALQVETKAAHDATDGVGWALASHLPAFGDDLAAVRTVAEVLDDLATDGLPALLDVASGLDPAALSPRAGRIDLTSLGTAAPRIAGGLAVIRRSRATVAGIDAQGLTGQLRDAVIQLGDGLRRAERLTATADRAARLLPSMLGANGPRTYLVLFQNNAEVRATGGMPGAYIVVRADGGAITIADQGTAAGDLKVFDSPVLPLDESLTALYTERPAVFPADVNLTPDFPTAAGLARAMYRKRTGVAVDGVVATDPVALSYLLRATGGVRLRGGESLSADNAVRLLLSEAYARFPDPADQDAYFATAARATFEALLKGQGDPEAILTQLARAAGERRLLVWTADEQEQAGLAGTVLAGRLPDSDSTAPTVGVFLNDGSGAKLSYYLNQTAELGVAGCEDDGSGLLRLRLTLASAAPTGGLPAYVTGLALSGDPYTVRTNVMVFGPAGGGVVSATLDGKEVAFGAGVERGRGVGVFTLDLPPGTAQTLEIGLRTGALPATAGQVVPRLWTTPTVRPWKTTVTSGPGCRP